MIERVVLGLINLGIAAFTFFTKKKKRLRAKQRRRVIDKGNTKDDTNITIKQQEEE
jgi:hypothetical protein